MDMPNQYYNQGRRGSQPGGMPYQTPMGGMNEPIATFPNFTPMGGGNMSGPVATFPNSTPMGGGVGNYPMGPTNPLPVPGPTNRGTRIPGGPLQESPLKPPVFPNGGPSNANTGVTGIWQGNPSRGIPGEWGSIKTDPAPQNNPYGTFGDWGQWKTQGRPRRWDNTGGRRIPAGGGQVIDGGWDRGRQQGRGQSPSGGNNSMNNSFPAQNSRSWAYRPNQRSNRYSTGGNMNANRMREAYRRRGANRGATGFTGYPSPVSGRYQTPRGGMNSFDTGGLNANPYGGLGRRTSHPDFGPYRSPGMPSVTNRNTYNSRTYNTNRNYDNRRTYNTQTFNQGDTSIQGPRIAKKMDRMQGYNPMMHGSQSRQIGGLRNLQRMLMALRGGRR